jgi:hypothetical protein|tara:strand:- start:2168 stop:2614 length:447 start_codon:yes stop_codon:yes gene_type:complete
MGSKPTLLNGEPVTIWKDRRLHAEWIWRLVGKELGEIQLTRDELEKFKPELEPEAESVSDHTRESVGRFQLPNKADDLAIAIVDYGNRYIKENGRVPTFVDLQGYMLKVGKDTLQLTYDPRGKDYIFGDKPLAKRQFRERYDSYLKSE